MSKPYRLVLAYQIARTTECIVECPDGQVVRFDNITDAQDWIGYEEYHDEQVRAESDPILAARLEAEAARLWDEQQRRKQERLARGHPF